MQPILACAGGSAQAIPARQHLRSAAGQREHGPDAPRLREPEPDDAAVRGADAERLGAAPALEAADADGAPRAAAAHADPLGGALAERELQERAARERGAQARAVGLEARVGGCARAAERVDRP